MTNRLSEPKFYSQAPDMCTKPGCGGTVFLPHEDGWQCFNCMKIIYKTNERLKTKISVKRYARNN
jgi:hypothetical protein